MNFNELYNSIFSEAEIEGNKDVYKLKIIHTKFPIIFAGIDIVSKKRQLYIDLGPERWEDEYVKSLPKWRGLSTKMEFFEKLVIIKQHYFLVISQESEESTEIFEMVLQNLVDHLMIVQDEDKLFSIIYNVLDRWRNFFQKGGFRILTEEKQRGLFGELMFIKNWLLRYPGTPPLIIEQWEGPTSGRIDFVSSRCGVEIKTTIDKLSKSVKISNEKQLKLSPGILKLFLYVSYIEPSKTHGISLENLTKDLRSLISERSARLALIFDDYLKDLRFRSEDYCDSFFYVEKNELYEVEENFPKLTDEFLPTGVSHVSYSLDLSHCKKYKKDIEEVYNFL